jgi:hypothetical protein
MSTSPTSSTGLGHDLALRVHRVGGEAAGVDRVLDVRVAHQVARGIRRRDRQVEALARAAVVLADDDILRDVDETAREVARVRRTERRVGEALAGTVRGDEVLRHRQPLAVRGDDRARDDLALRVVHEASHAGDVAHLQPVTTSARRDHAVDGVVGREVLLHGLGDLVGRLGPDLDELLATLEVGREALLELRLHLGGLLLVPPDDLALGGGRDDVRERDGHAGTGRPAEAGVLDPVEGRGDLGLRVALGEVVHDRRDLALAGLLVEERVVRRQRLVEERTTERGLEEVRLA